MASLVRVSCNIQHWIIWIKIKAKPSDVYKFQRSLNRGNDNEERETEGLEKYFGDGLHEMDKKDLRVQDDFQIIHLGEGRMVLPFPEGRYTADRVGVR